VETEGTRTYQVSYRLGRLAGEHLDFELPAPVATISLAARLNGKGISYEELASDGRSGEPGRARGTLVRFRLSRQLVRRPAVLELSYQLPPDRVGRTPLTTPLMPPRPLGEAGRVPARVPIPAPP